MRLQLSRGTKHQILPLVKTDSEPEVLPDRPVKLIKTVKHNKLGGDYRYIKQGIPHQTLGASGVLITKIE